MRPFMDDREIQISRTVRGIDAATVAPTLFLVILAGLNIDNRRLDSLVTKSHPLGYQGEITDWREIGYAKKHGRPLVEMGPVAGVAGPDYATLGVTNEIENGVPLFALGETLLHLGASVRDVVAGVINGVVDILDSTNGF